MSFVGSANTFAEHINTSIMKRIITSTLACFVLWGMAAAQTFTLKSNEVGGQATQKQFANSFGCHGENISPQLSWENAPAGTQSFAVTVYDKDAPTGSGFWHWVIFNIPANTSELKSGAGDLSKSLAPKDAVQSNNDSGMPGYLGPCPPPGAPHEYLITVFALKSKLQLDKNTTPAVVGFYMSQLTLGKASIVIYAQQ
jgi:Raf kinase inhibitor-like YbhB/YbcL family protein